MLRLKHLIICFIKNAAEKGLDLDLILRIFSKCSEKFFFKTLPGCSFKLVQKQLFIGVPKKGCFENFLKRYRNTSAMDHSIFINLHVKPTALL